MIRCNSGGVVHHRVYKGVQPSRVTEGLVQPSCHKGLAMPIISPGEAIASKTNIFKARCHGHLIKFFERERGGRAGAEFFFGQEDGIEVSYHTPWEGRRRTVNQVVPNNSPLPVVNRAIDSCDDKGGRKRVRNGDSNVLGRKILKGKGKFGALVIETPKRIF